MPGPKAIEIKLNEEEKNALEKLIRGHNTGQQIALRARIVLAAEQGKSNSQIVRELGVSMNTVRLWRSRWSLFEPIPLRELNAEERLEDLPRPGAPLQIRNVSSILRQLRKGFKGHWLYHQVAVY